MLLWLAHRAWNLFCDPQGDCLGQRGAFLSHDFGLPRTGLSLAIHSGSFDSLHSSLGTSSSSVWALGLRWNGPKPLEPSGPTSIFQKKVIFNVFFMEKQKLILWVPVSSTGKVSDYWIRNLGSILIYTKNWLVSLYLKKQKLIFYIYIYIFIFSETMYGIYFWEAYLMPIYSLSILTKQKHVPSLSSKIVTSKHLSWF